MKYLLLLTVLVFSLAFHQLDKRTEELTEQVNLLTVWCKIKKIRVDKIVSELKKHGIQDVH